MTDLIKQKLDCLPLVPGCYLMKSETGDIIYVGKAKKLKKRVSSYFLLNHNGKTAKLVSEIADFDIIITNSEREALLLEINLIHKYYPKYNVMLKDDRSYPYIKITNEDNPRLLIVRDTKDKKAKYYGPYSDSNAAYEMVQLLNRIYPFRKCRHIPKKECLYYHLKQCLGPCIEKVNRENYKEVIENVTKFLSGEIQEVRDEFHKRMLDAATELHFEEAKEYRGIIENINHIISKQKVDLPKKNNIDVVSFHEKSDYVCIIILMYRMGILNAKESTVLNNYGSIDELISSYLLQFYQKHIPPKEIIMSEVESKKSLEEILKLKITNPKSGFKKDLLIMAGENALKSMDDYFIHCNISQEDIKHQVLIELGQLLSIKTPRRIELYDNSHLQGDNAVGVMVAFINGVAAKKEYRKYKIKNEIKSSDYHSMMEIIKRRIARMIEQKGEEPNLIIVDGGLIQINAAVEVFNEYNLDIPIIGLVKDAKHRTNAIQKRDGQKIDLDTSSKLFHFLTRMQDEVHRFAITFFRNSKNKSLTSSILDSIPGVGTKRKEILMRAFGTVKMIKESSIAELKQYVSEEVALNIKKALENH